MNKVPMKEIPKPMPVYHHKRHESSIVVTVWAFLYACSYVYGRVVFDGLDWFGKKLVGLIDHSDFFAGVVWTYAVLTAWELLTR